ncbi:hypothetical protein BDQ17DRAFT_1362298 [Cyathus striatus]|nr:hypothetical protein BDQ17DRAFT_1362298 [Cyathus striatus]
MIVSHLCQSQPVYPQLNPNPPDLVPFHPPESITVRRGSFVNHRSTSNLHRTTDSDRASRSRCPAMSHQSIVVSPEGCTPTLGEDTTIVLSPSHELGEIGYYE